MTMNVRQLAARVQVDRVGQQQGQPSTRAPDTQGSSFADELRRARTTDAPATSDFKISAHAQHRISQRGITMNPGEQESIRSAFEQLEAKGARSALLLRSDAAFVVNVPNRTVVTAINQTEMQDRVFTQIDSAMLV